MATSVVLHVGAPKSGTTHVQSRLRRNRESLAAHGVLVTAENPTFRAALDLTGVRLGRGRGYTDGWWQRLVDGVGAHFGQAVVSDEAFVRSDDAAAARAVGGLGVTDVVYTARDLARQLVSGWLEGLKHGQSASFGTYLDRARCGELRSMRAYDLPVVLGRWATAVGDAQRVHLVTVPPAGGDLEALWSRFCTASGLEPTWAPAPAARSNVAVGLPEAQLLRLLNERLGEDAGRGGRLHTVVQERVVAGLTRGDSPRVTLAPEHQGWVRERTATWLDGARELGVSVVGDLADLVPAAVTPGAWADPDDVSPPVVAEADRLAAELRAG